MKLWLTKSSYTGEYVVWKTKPEALFGNDYADVMYVDGEVVARGLYAFDQLFPKLCSNIQPAGRTTIELTETDNGYLLRKA